MAHYSLSWAPDERPPTQAKMVTAALASLRALGLEDHQAVLVAHRDGTTPHVHVVANRVSIEDGRAAPLRQSRLKLSRWAETYERQQGRIRCPRRVEHNRDRRLVGLRYDPYRTASMYDWHATGDAHYRRTQCGRIARVPRTAGRRWRWRAWRCGAWTSSANGRRCAIAATMRARRWTRSSAGSGRRCTPARRTSGIGSTGTLDRCAAGSSGGVRASDPGATSAA